MRGVFLHYKELGNIGDVVEALSDVLGVVPKGTKAKIINILIEPITNERGFQKRIILEGYKGEFNPKKFKKVVVNK